MVKNMKAIFPSLAVAFFCFPGVPGLATETPAPTEPKITWVDATDPTVTDIRAAGERNIERVGRALISEVDQTVAARGPAEALAVLHLKNFPLPKPGPGQPRVTIIKFPSLRVRNPDNRPDAADQAALDRIQSELDAGNAPPSLLIQRIERPSAPVEWRVYRPIGTSNRCLACHGDQDSLSPAVRAELDRLYPHDQATGYSAQQWCGVIRLSLVAAEPGPPVHIRKP